MNKFFAHSSACAAKGLIKFAALSILSLGISQCGGGSGNSNDDPQVKTPESPNPLAPPSENKSENKSGNHSTELYDPIIKALMDRHGLTELQLTPHHPDSEFYIPKIKDIQSQDSSSLISEHDIENGLYTTDVHETSDQTSDDPIVSEEEAAAERLRYVENYEKDKPGDTCFRAENLPPENVVVSSHSNILTNWSIQNIANCSEYVEVKPHYTGIDATKLSDTDQLELIERRDFTRITSFGVRCLDANFTIESFDNLPESADMAKESLYKFFRECNNMVHYTLIFKHNANKYIDSEDSLLVFKSHVAKNSDAQIVNSEVSVIYSAKESALGDQKSHGTEIFVSITDGVSSLRPVGPYFQSGHAKVKRSGWTISLTFQGENKNPTGTMTNGSETYDAKVLFKDVKTGKHSSPD